MEHEVTINDIENLYKSIMTLTDGKKIIPDYTQRTTSDCKHIGFGIIGDGEYLNSAEGKIEQFLFLYFDFDGEVAKMMHPKFSELERAETIWGVSKKKIINLRTTLAQIDAKINQLTKELVKIFESALQNEFTEELKALGNEFQAEKSKYEYLKKLLTDYEKILIDDVAYCENVYRNEFRKEFGKKLRDARIKLNLTIEKLAELVGKKRLSINNYELGLRDPSAFTLYRLCKVLGVSMNYLLGLEASDNANNQK